MLDDHTQTGIGHLRTMTMGLLSNVSIQFPHTTMGMRLGMNVYVKIGPHNKY